MKRIITVILLIFCIIGLITYVSYNKFTNTTSPNLANQEPSFQDELCEENLRKHVEFLCKDGDRDASNTEKMAPVITYISDYFKQVGLKPTLMPYKKVDQTFYNISAVIPGSVPDRIVIGAHYDSAPGSPGADDNASGVAGLLETAKLLAGSTHHYTIELIAYANEEAPYFNTQFQGSRVHFADLQKKNIPVKLMVCLEMIGYFDNQPNTQAYPTELLAKVYPDKADFIAILGDMNSINATETIQKGIRPYIPTVRLNAPQFEEFQLSDHLVFIENKIPVTLITDTAMYRSEHYHQKSDTPDTLNYPNMQKIVKGLAQALKKLANQE